MEEKRSSVKALVLIIGGLLLAVALIGTALWVATHGQDKEAPQEPVQDSTDAPDDGATQPEPANDADEPQWVNWGDDVGGRLAYSGEEIAAGVLDGMVVLNSRLYDEGFLNDARDFVKIMRIEETESGGSVAVLCEGHDIPVEEGTYLINVYIQNDSPETVSENTRVGVGIPMASGQSLEVSGWIFSDNAVATEMWTALRLHSEKPFHIEYIYESGLLWRKGFDSEDVLRLPDAIVTKVASENGTPVGWEELNGELPGGEDYLVTAQIAVKVVYDEVAE